MKYIPRFMLFKTTDKKIKIEYCKGDQIWRDSIQIYFLNYWLVILLF